MENEDTLASIGAPLEEDRIGQKDAVHIAVVAVVAGETLKPGAFVSVDGDGRAVPEDEVEENHVGVVDPFLGVSVLQGEVFWLWIRPGRITGLRHEWWHPQFPSTADDTDRRRLESMTAVVSFCRVNGLDFEGLLDEAKRHGDVSFGSMEADEMWYPKECPSIEDLEKAIIEVLRERGVEKTKIRFSCAC